jgi:diguanylate cyclase (GGDEF)-like protein
MHKPVALKPVIMPVIGCALACVSWFIDSAIDSYIFNTQKPYLESLLHPETIDLWSRCQFIILLMVFSIIAMYMMRRDEKIRQQINKHNDEVEHVAKQRMDDLHLKNSRLQQEIIEHQKIEEELAHLATIDPLTLISNRRKFDEVLRYELTRDSRYHNELTLIFFDLDHFKTINDQHGHKIGDDVLKEFTRLISGKIRKTDVFSRWGGEEFAILLPETSLATAIQTAEKLRSETENHLFPYVGKITASFGVSQFFDGDNENTFINRADNALYRAKRNGRNRIEVLPSSDSLLHTFSRT